MSQKLHSKQSSQPSQPSQPENAEVLEAPAEDAVPAEPTKPYNVDLTRGLDKLQPLDSTWEQRNVLGDGHFFELKNN